MLHYCACSGHAATRSARPATRSHDVLQEASSQSTECVERVRTAQGEGRGSEAFVHQSVDEKSRRCGTDCNEGQHAQRPEACAAAAHIARRTRQVVGQLRSRRLPPCGWPNVFARLGHQRVCGVTGQQPYVVVVVVRQPEHRVVDGQRSKQLDGKLWRRSSEDNHDLLTPSAVELGNGSSDDENNHLMLEVTYKLRHGSFEDSNHLLKLIFFLQVYWSSEDNQDLLNACYLRVVLLCHVVYSQLIHITNDKLSFCPIFVI